MIAQNYSNFGFPVDRLVPGVSLINFHYAFPAAVDGNYGLNMAIGCDETGFVGQDDAAYLREAWNFMLAGGGLFDSLDYSFTVGHEDGTDAAPNGPGGGSPALRQQLGILAKFLSSMPLVRMTPDSRTVKHAAGVSARALSATGGPYAMYFDGNGPSAVVLSLSAGDYAGRVDGHRYG